MDPPARQEDRPAHLLLPPGVRLPVRETAVRLVPLLGGTVPDLAHKLRYSGGWIGRGLPAELADQVEAIVKELGVVPFRVPGDSPVTAPVTRRVLDAALEGEDTLLLRLAGGTEQIPISTIACLDFVALGRLVEIPEEQQNPMLRSAELLREEQSHAGQRASFLAHDSRALLPTLILTLREPIEFLVIEKGARFPELAREGIGGSLENLLRFTQSLLERLPACRVLPETLEFWESADLEAILVASRAELEERMTWLEEILARRLWEGFL